MAERTRTKEREAEAAAPDARLYEPKYFEHVVDELKRSMMGRIVVHGRERLWDVHKQAKTKRYLSPHEPELRDTALQEWEVFLQLIPERSGKHRHQGGLIIFVLEGSGHTIIEGERYDWEEGDLMLLPVRPGGVEHQHFNHDSKQPAKWIAFVYWPFFNAGGSETTQIETSPIYDSWVADLEKKQRAFDA